MSDFSKVVGLEEGEIVEGLFHLAHSDFHIPLEDMAAAIDAGMLESPAPIRDVSTMGYAIVTNFDVYMRFQFAEGYDHMGITYQDDWYISTNRIAYEAGLTPEDMKEQAHYIRAAFTENGTRIE